MFYIAHRLFAAHDRALGAQLAQLLTAHVGPAEVFLPFCDTDEEDLVAEVKGRRLFELDTERLETLTGLLAVLHGPSLDDGVSMEIGYAAALGVPIVVLSTDFISYSLTEHGHELTFPDPLIQTVASHIVHAPSLAPAGHDTNPYPAYHHRNTRQLTNAAEQAITTLLHLAQPSRPNLTPPPGTQAGGVFGEPSPYWHDPAFERACSALANQLTPLGPPVITATRLSAPDPLAAAAHDWAALAGSAPLLADTSGPETPARKWASRWPEAGTPDHAVLSPRIMWPSSGAALRSPSENSSAESTPAASMEDPE